MWHETARCIARDDAVPVIRELREVAKSGGLDILLQVAEIRTVAADELWLSPTYRQPSLAIHFTWSSNDEGTVRAGVSTVEMALAPFAPRPHWGAFFVYGPQLVASLYPKLPAFRELVERVDPTAKFRNDFLERFVFGKTRVTEIPYPTFGTAVVGRMPRPYDLIGNGHSDRHVGGRLDEPTEVPEEELTRHQLLTRPLRDCGGQVRYVNFEFQV